MTPIKEKPMSECAFCGQEHEPMVSDTPGSLLFGIPVNVCPNIPRTWMGITDRHGLLVTDLHIDSQTETS